MTKKHESKQNRDYTPPVIPSMGMAVLKPKKESIQEAFRVYGGILPSHITPVCKKHPCKQNDVMIVDFSSRNVYEPYMNDSHRL
jgi:hypothetical protein